MSITAVTVTVTLQSMAKVIRTTEQKQVLSQLRRVQDRLNQHDHDLIVRGSLVTTARSHGLTLVDIADHIGVQSSMLGQAEHRRRRASR